MVLRSRSAANEGYLPIIPSRAHGDRRGLAVRGARRLAAALSGVLNGQNGVLRVTLALTEAVSRPQARPGHPPGRTRCAPVGGASRNPRTLTERPRRDHL